MACSRPTLPAAPEHVRPPPWAHPRHTLGTPSAHPRHTLGRAFEIIAEAAQGRTAHDNVDELQRFIQRRPDRHLPPPRLPPGNAQGMMRTVTERSLNVATGFVSAGGSAASAAVGLVRTASGRITQAMLPPQQQVVAVGMPPGGQVPQGQPVVAQAVPLV
jgi:hypothetical protein